MPEYDYAKEPNRCWLANIINSLIDKIFQEYIVLMMKNQHRDAKESNIVIQAQPQFMSIFRKSEAVSKIKGKLRFAMRPPKPQKLLKKRNILRR